jgi:hypothetical protein
VSDATRLEGLLQRHEDGSPNFDCRLIVAPNAGKLDVVTRSSLRSAIDDLFKHPADVVLFSFSGHGSENNLGGYLVTQDAKKYDEGVSMSDIIAMANQSKVNEAVLLIDCCHSGHLGNTLATDNKAVLREGVSILTASRGEQVSVEVSGGGLFTSLVVDALYGGAADILGHVTTSGIYAYVQGALGSWDQRPLFKSHVARLVPIRHCDPAIEVSTLRELPILFPVPAENLLLTPAFEPSSDQKDHVKVEIFQKLQALCRAHLVVPVGTDHMYDAAMQSKACRLTASGRYYWRLAMNGRI